jgi:CMP-N-acetylneuraminic acid synthetase
MSEVIGIIPVRGGSKGVERKNMRSVAGHPLLWHTVTTARSAGILDRVIVSTDDSELAAYARSLRAEVVRHPPELSRDDSPTFPVIRWDLHELRQRSIEPSIIAVMRATTPLRSADDIVESIRLLQCSTNADSVVSVVEAIGIHPVRLKRVVQDGYLQDAFEVEGRIPRRRQELEQLFLRNGAIYVSRPHVIDAGGLWGNRCLAYVMPEERSLNINTEYQLRLADLLLRERDAS